MTKCYVIGGCLTERHKDKVRAVAEEKGYSVTFFDSNKEADGKVADAEVLFSPNPWLLQQMPNLKWVHTPNAGVDSFIRSGVFDSGEVLLSNSAGAYGLAISEHVIMVTLMLMRRFPEYQKIVREGKWVHDLPVRSISGSRITVLGTGNVGCNVALKFRNLGAESVTGFSRSGIQKAEFDRVYRIEDFDEHAGDVDVLVLCLPATPETAGVITAERLALLPETALVVNVGRGMLIDQDALISALNDGRIAGAALDVMVPEPLPKDHPLRTAKNCIITPHVSGDSGLEATVDITVRYLCENMVRFAEGRELINRIDLSKGY